MDEYKLGLPINIVRIRVFFVSLNAGLFLVLNNEKNRIEQPLANAKYKWTNIQPRQVKDFYALIFYIHILYS